MDLSDLTHADNAQLSPAVAFPSARGLLSALLLCLLVSSLGCNTISSSKLAKQLQSENERLLTEYRAQKSINEQLQRKNQVLESRVAESEKLLAQQNGGSRISSLSGRLGASPLAGNDGQYVPSSASTGFPPVDSSLKWESR